MLDRPPKNASLHESPGDRNMMVSTNTAQSLAIRREKSLTTQVAEEIERMITSGSIKPGERINEKHLADRLDVSRGIVREARRGLEHSGLLISIPHKGVFVRRVSPEELEENNDMRALVTGFICAEAAKKISVEQLRRLQDLIDAMDTYLQDDHYQEYYQANIEFHDALLEAAGHQRAASIYNQLVAESNLARKIVLSNHDHMIASNSEHRDILDAVRQGDAEAARHAGELHVKQGYERFRQQVVPTLNASDPA
ncbi:GntR family transcriptional regulator [Halomonas faecis]|uniref:GntR family transcriptional regulator n=1 Tax=Halomonas faecis TaxID=1562110 RepID=UPI0013D20455|nr:GntR family transcriptional regulator [Halomonas faecis]